MSEVIERRCHTPGKFMNALGLNELPPFGQPFADLLDILGYIIRGCGDSPCRKAVSGNAAGLKDALLRRAKLIELDLQHLAQSVGHAWINLLDGRRKTPGAVVLHDQALFDQSLRDRHHEQSVSARASVDQI